MDMDSARIDTIIQAIHRRFAAIHGIVVILDYEPRAVQATPLLYTLLDGFQRTDQAGQVATVYRFMHRFLFVHAKDPQASEAHLRRFASIAPGVLRADPALGNVLTSGTATLTEGVTGFVTIDGTEYRNLDLYSRVLDKQHGDAIPLRRGIASGVPT